jgi:D-alanyl-D-alanine carboxypeptidase
MKKMAFLFAVLIAFVMACGACVYAEEPADSADQTETTGVNYLIMVSQQADIQIPSDWEETITLVSVTDFSGGEQRLEEKTSEKYLELKDALAEEGINIEITKAYVSVDDQVTYWDFNAEQFGRDYAEEHVIKPGFLDNHTGMSMDLCLIKDGEAEYSYNELSKETEIFAKIHAMLPDYGFIVRYPEGKEDITGQKYQPWHIRYVGSVDVAKEIAEKGITLEEYLGG